MAAARVWKPFADAGDPDAMYELCYLYVRSQNLENRKRGAELRKTAAAAGQPLAQYEIAERKGEWPCPSHLTAEETLRQIQSEADAAQERIWRPYADADDADAMYELGALYWNSEDDEVSAQGEALLQKAVELGSGDALYALHEQQGPEDLEITKRAAMMGSGDAARHVGVTYAWGERVPQDFSESFRWYKIGAAFGNAECQYDLGFMCLGQGTTINVAEGLVWLEKAGTQESWGAALAATLLADCYGHGYYGVTPDPERAEYWRRRRDELE